MQVDQYVRVCIATWLSQLTRDGGGCLGPRYVEIPPDRKVERELAASLPRWDEEAVSWSFSVARLRFAADGKDKQRGDQKVFLSLDERRLA